ncbi:hypothetical protein Tco_0764803 [Tanacetum coccineum]
MLDVVQELERILEKIPETGADFSDPESRSFVESSSMSLPFIAHQMCQGVILVVAVTPLMILLLSRVPLPETQPHVHLTHVPQTITLSMFDSKLTAKVDDFELLRFAQILDDYEVGPNYVSNDVRGTPISCFPSYFLAEKA